MHAIDSYPEDQAYVHYCYTQGIIHKVQYQYIMHTESDNGFQVFMALYIVFTSIYIKVQWHYTESDKGTGFQVFKVSMAL